MSAAKKTNPWKWSTMGMGLFWLLGLGLHFQSLDRARQDYLSKQQEIESFPQYLFFPYTIELVQVEHTQLYNHVLNQLLVEFQQELDIKGEMQHLAHICELQSWVILLSKGEEQIHQLSKWFVKNEDTIL